MDNKELAKDLIEGTSNPLSGVVGDIVTKYWKPDATLVKKISKEEIISEIMKNTGVKRSTAERYLREAIGIVEGWTGKIAERPT